MNDDQRAQLRNQLRLLGFASVVVLVGGLASGVVFGRVNPESAAARQLLDFDVFEGDLEREDTDPEEGDRLDAAPTSGQPRGVVRCGVGTAPPSLDDQRGTVAAGRVIVQHGPELAADRLEELEALVAADPDAYLVAPASPDLALEGDELVATAWLWRLGPQAVSPRVIEAFQIAHGGNGPDRAEPCVAG